MPENFKSQDNYLSLSYSATSPSHFTLGTGISSTETAQELEGCDTFQEAFNPRDRNLKASEVPEKYAVRFFNIGGAESASAAEKPRVLRSQAGVVSLRKTAEAVVVLARVDCPVEGAHNISASVLPHPCLLSLPSTIMPRGNKSKHRAREKRRRARGDPQSAKGAQASAAEEEGSSPSEGSPQRSENPCVPPGIQRTPPTTTDVVPVSSAIAAKGAKGRDEGKPSSSGAPLPTEKTPKDPLSKKESMLMQFLLQKYKMKEPVTKAEMIKKVNKKYKEHFPEILRKTTEWMEMVFGLVLKAVDSSGQSYTLVSKVDITNEGSLNDDCEHLKNGLLMPLLGVIFLKGDRATKEEISEFLNVLGMHESRRHLICGDPWKFISKTLVEKMYLEYQQVPNSNPPRYEFLWGPRAHAETSKMEVLQYLAKVFGTSPSAFPVHYEEALRDEAKRATARDAARADASAKASTHSRATSSTSSTPSQI
ncbi:PREDICTED: melanoma-associated antigen B4-like [Chrysochloris asiatica]|uniref:Melanoma-associated antigen B4-like n=1 Tax=Chrysochloris asiatica TaxID=185453 RepID=A0A9B0WI42_CHRAS|nr:PREDICTED: melanoma-associated antigen B4-like [Chrysochloris asiatica]